MSEDPSDVGGSCPRRRSIQRVVLELSTLIYFLSRSAATPIVQQYVYYLVARKYNYTAAKNGTDDLEDRVSEESSLFIVYMTIAELLPASFVVVFLGKHSDAIRKRRFLMWLPCIGNAVYAVGILLPYYIDDADGRSTVDLRHVSTICSLLVASVCSGLGGSIPGFMSGYATYVSDDETPSASGRRRTVRLAICEMTIGLSTAASSLAAGFWIGDRPETPGRVPNFRDPLWAVFGSSLLAAGLLVLGVDEPSGTPSHHDSVAAVRADRGPAGRCCGGSGRGSSGCFPSAPAGRRRVFWSIFVAYQLYAFVQQGQERTIVLYAQSPRPVGWGPLDVGIGLAILYGLAAVGSWPGIPLMHRCVGDLAIAVLAVASKLVGSALLAAATDSKLVYAALAVQLFHLTPYAVVRSLASKQLGDSQQGSFYALLHCIQAAVAFLGPVAHTALFTATVRQGAGFVFIVSGSFLVIPLLLFIYVMMAERRRSASLSVNEETEGLLDADTAATTTSTEHSA